MKKTIALLLALVMVFALCACGQSSAPAPEESKAPEAEASEAPATENQHFDKLTLEFVPSKDADVIIAGTKNLPELVQAEMSKLGYDIDEVDITVGTSYDATGEAMSAGSIDLGWLPGGTYALYSDDVDVILTATRNGLSNDSTNPADWNGEARRTARRSPTTAPSSTQLLPSTARNLQPRSTPVKSSLGKTSTRQSGQSRRLPPPPVTSTPPCG